MPTRPNTFSFGKDGSAVAKRRATNNRTAVAVRNTYAWRQLRDSFRTEHPVCIDPLGLHPHQVKPTEQIHHIKPIEQSPELAYERENLAPLCASCHDKIERKERSGTNTQNLFKQFQRDNACATH